MTCWLCCWPPLRWSRVRDTREGRPVESVVVVPSGAGGRKGRI